MLIIKKIPQFAILELQDPVINLTFVRHFLNGRHSPEGFTYMESLNHHKIPKIVTIILCFIENETETQKINHAVGKWQSQDLNPKFSGSGAHVF